MGRTLLKPPDNGGQEDDYKYFSLGIWEVTENLPVSRNNTAANVRNKSVVPPVWKHPAIGYGVRLTVADRSLS